MINRILKKNKLIVILGPTASGKSELAIRLAREFSGVIISADSRQIYKFMDIGTDKPAGKWVKKNKEKIFLFKNIPHYLIDIIKPDREFTLTHYKKKAISEIKKAQIKNKLPLLVGGTGLYISAIVNNLQIPKVAPNKKLRQKLEAKNSLELLNRLKKLDPKMASVIDSNNKRRLIRALEVCLSTGLPFSEQQKKGKPPFEVLQIGLMLPRDVLYQKIDRRVDKMIKDGLVREVRNLYKKGYNWNLPSMSGIGYKQIGFYLQGRISLNKAVDLIKQETRKYAKRQITWFKKDKRIKWIKNPKKVAGLIEEFLK